MGRARRIQAADTVYHVTARGIRRLHVYEDAVDYRKFEQLVETLVGKRHWVVHAYCQMPNHYHLVFESPEPDLSSGLCWLNGVYARWFNERHGYSGHVFESRFHASIVRSNVHLLNLACYVPLNPVRAGLCAAPREWPWSSYLTTIGHAQKNWLRPGWLLAQFGRERIAAMAEYARYVDGRLAA